MAIAATATAIADVLIIEPKVLGDDRGFFLESFSARDFESATGLRPQFVQDNHSRSAKGVLRGLHYQIEHAQAKLVRVIAGEAFDVVVDLRRTSPTFGKWTSVVLSAENKRQVWVPVGLAHGFLAMKEGTEVLYKTTDYHYPEHERCLLWNDPTLAIDWPLNGAPQLAAKDAAGRPLSTADTY